MKNPLFKAVVAILASSMMAWSNERIADVLADPALDISRPADRARAVERIRAIENANLERARVKAKAKGVPMRRVLPNGKVREIVGLDENGDFLIYVTHNATAAVSSAANLVHSSPYTLDGSGVPVGVWDEAAVRVSHQEFQTGSGSRVTVRDGTTTLSSHATHVAGTVAAAGASSTAKGMAPNALVDSYNWTSDTSEMTAAAATGPGQAGKLTISNHSYGFERGWGRNSSNVWQWYGTGTDQNGYAAQFGQYNSYARSWDTIAFNAPYYLIFASAGNDNNDNPANGNTVVIDGVTTTYNNSIHPAGDGLYRNTTTNSTNAYENLADQAVSKNLMTMGAANDAVTGGLRDPAKSTLASFSSRGAADDGRIKPDIVANGVGLTSTDIGSDTSYSSKSGTSMSSPSAAGSAALLVQAYRNRFPGGDMRASTLKGLIIHTATDIGNPGPDYHFGWGLMDTKEATDLIIDHHANPLEKRMAEEQLSTATASRTYTFSWDGISPIRATMCWTDPAAASTSTHDLRTSRLVNDLDLKLIAPDGTQHYPFIMPYVGTWTAASLSQNATTGINSTDNVEQVLIQNPAQSGTWQVIVNHKGALTNNQQNYSLLLSGLSAAPPVAEVSRGGSPIAVNGVDSVSGTGVGTGKQLAYAISNTGGGQLELTTPVTISSQTNCAVSVQTQPSGTVSAGTSTSLGLTVTPVAGGTWSFKVSIANNDPDRDPYHWTVTGIAGSSATVSFTPIADTYINDQATTTNYGTETVISLNNQTGGNPANRAVVRGLLRFDLSSIPAGATVSSAKLDFVQGNTNSGSVEIVEATASWWETSAISPPNPGATWSNSSGIYGATSYGTATTGTTSGAAVPTITLNSSGLSKVQNWVNSPSGNHGFGITTTNAGSGSSNWLALRSREHATTSNHPRLTLTYGGGSANLPLMTVSDSNGLITNGGSVSVSGSEAGAGSQSTYAIQNLGTSNLTLTTPVGIAAMSNCSVTVNTQPSSPVGPSGSTNLILTVTPTASGSWSATISVANNDPDKSPYTWAITGSASKAQATLALNGLAQPYDGTPRVVTATTSPPGLSYSVTYNGLSAAPTNAGSYDVVATITDPGYEGTTSGTLVVSKPSQTIAFAALDPVGNDQGSFSLTATASSGLTVSYTSSNTSVATVSGSTVSVIASGTTTITASQAGNGNYHPATNVARELEVVPVAPVANSGGPYKVLIGQSLSLNGSASAPSFGETLTAYDWDLNNDGTFGDVTGATPSAIAFNTLMTTWGMSQGLNTIQLRVTDSAAKTATISTTVELVLSLQWDSNGTLAGQTNGGGAWLDNNLWWDGSANTSWVSGSNAVFGGPSTNGGSVTLASPTAANSLVFNAFTGTYTFGTSGQAITLGEGITMNAGSGNSTIVSPVTLGADQAWTNNSGGTLATGRGVDLINNNGFQLTVDGSGTYNFGIINNADAALTGSGDLVKNGSGRLNIGGVNSGFSGTVTLNGGVTQVNNNSAPLGEGNVTLNGGVMSFYWGTTFSRTLGTGDNQVQIPGGESGFAGAGTSGPSVSLGAGVVVWGALGEGSATGHFNPSKFVLGDEGTTNAAATTFSNGIDLNGVTRTIIVPKGLSSGGNVSTVTGAISSSTGAAGLIKEGEGTLVLSAANTYTGDTTISGGNLRIGNNTTGTLNSGNYSANISIASGAALQIWSSAAQTLSGTISGAGGLDKAYGGALTLSGPNTYTGRTSFLPQTTSGFTVNVSSFNSINGGTPLMASSSLGAPTTVADGTIDLGSGGKQASVTLNYTGPGETTDRVINLGFNGSASQTISASGSGLLKFTGAMTSNAANQAGKFILSGTGSGEIAQALPNLPTGGLSKSGAGIWTLGGANAYSGPTTISAGKLFINGSLSNTAAALNVGTGATLGGNGTIGRNVTVDAGGKLEFDISTAAASHSRLNISSGRDFAFSGASELTITSSAGAAPGTYTLITGGNSITGVAPATVNLPADWVANVSISGNSLILDVISTGGSGPVDHFVISSITDTQTVGTAINGITITAQDSSNATATGFSGTVTFGGTGGFSGISASFTAGVLSNVSVTPSVAGSDLTLTVNDDAGHTGSTVIATIQSVYNGWSGSLGFNDDSSGDGIANGLAWALGAASPSVNATGILPIFDNASNADYAIYTYRRSDVANADATIVCQYGSDLSGSWTPAIHDGTNVIITVSDNFYGTNPGVDKVEVKIKRTLAIEGKIFTRLHVTPNP